MSQSEPASPIYDPRVYDYVIVGAGAAGCVLAERLSRDASRTVCLLEAGPPDTHPMIHMPKGVGRILSEPNHVWAFPVTPRAGSNAKPEYWVRGRTLGGSSSTNGMMYVRGQPADFDALADATSDDWSWRNIAAAYRAMEAHPLGRDETRGDDGPLKLSFKAQRHAILDRLIESAEAAGLTPTDDVNAPDDRERVGYCPQTIWRGRRQSAAVAFLNQAKNRRNLTIRTGGVVDRISFDGRTADGVLLAGESGAELVRGRKIILCAGAFGSPMILQRSGVGSGAMLRTLHIPVVADRPAVGQNLHEHCGLNMQWRLKRGSQNHQYRGARLLMNAAGYYLSGGGPLATATFEVGGWFKTDPDQPRPNAQFLAAPFSIDKSKTQMATETQPGMQFVVYPLRPRGAGEVNITARDPAAPPATHFDYFADAEDRREMIGAVRFVRRMMAQGAVAEMVVGETRPGPEAETDDEILERYRALGASAYHACGTCRIGADEAAVVDPLTRVRGVEALHVVDLSILPTIPAGNTFAPVIAVAWRAADLILGLEAESANGAAAA